MSGRQTGVISQLLRRFHRPVAFALVGLMNTAIDFLVFSLFLLLFHLPAEVAQIFGYCAGTLNSFLVNRRITFRSRGSDRLARQMLRYLLSCLIALGLSILFLSLFHSLLHWDAYVSKLLSMLLVFFFNYFCMNRFVFPQK